MSVQLNIIGSEHYVRKYCTEMNIKDYYMDQAIKIVKNIDKLNIITEHTQFSIAATSVLIMAELNCITNMTKKSLKNLFGVSNVTISKTYKKLEKIKHILIDDEKVNKLITKINKLNEEQQLTEDIKKRMEKFGINNNEHNEHIEHVTHNEEKIIIKNVKNDEKIQNEKLQNEEKPKKKVKNIINKSL